MNCVVVCNLKVWRVCLLLFHVAVSLQPSLAWQDFLVQAIPPAGAEAFQMLADEVASPDDQMRYPEEHNNYFYEHNETRVAQAIAEAEAEAEASIDGARWWSEFPDWNSSDGCNWENTALYLGISVGRTWYAPKPGDFVGVQLVAVDSCTYMNPVDFKGQPIQISSDPWHTPNSEVDVVESRFKKVLVEIHAVGLSILGEGVYCPITGKMQLVGCIFNVTTQDTYGIGNLEPEIPELMARSGDCEVSLTMQYPPRNPRWNWQRVVKFALRSTRDAGDPLYFLPVKRDIFYLYFDRLDLERTYSQEQLATGGRMLLLLLGLVCVVLQIQHGKHNEEALPFVSLSMLGIQIANHVSQTSVFQDLQIGQYKDLLASQRWPIDQSSMSISPEGEYSFLDSTADFEYYGAMAWHAHVPYQAMAMAAIFMYVWMFHRVGDRRLIMQLRVRKGRPGAVDPPREGQLAFATLTLFAIIGMIGILDNVMDQSIALGEPESLFGHTNYTGVFWELPPSTRIGEFISPMFYELWYAQWGVLNKITGLWVSLFLVPQLLGNWRWHVQGRPLSRWFYVGLPLLQSLPPLFTIAKYFQLLPILAFYDPYLDSFYGLYENPTPWWQMGVVSCSALVVVAVHLQFATSFRPSRSHSSTETPAAFTNL